MTTLYGSLMVMMLLFFIYNSVKLNNVLYVVSNLSSRKQKKHVLCKKKCNSEIDGKYYQFYQKQSKGICVRDDNIYFNTFSINRDASQTYDIDK